MSATANILVVDDSPENLLAVEAVLEPLGQRIVLARSGEEALRYVLNDDFAVILLDVRMPTMGGHETALLIKKRPRSRYTPIIFLTANDREMEGVMEAYSHGAVDVLFKPFHPEILRSKVAVFVELFAQREQLKAQEEQLRLQAREQAAREEAAEQERRLHSLFQQMPAVIGVLRAPDRVYVLANPSLHALYGERALLGKTARAAHPELAGTGLLDALDRVFDTGETFTADDFNIKVPVHGREPDDRYFHFTFRPMLGSDGNVDSVIVFAIEQTAHVRARKQAETAERRIAFLAEASSVLAASLDYASTLDTLAHLAVPAFADVCFIDVLDDDGTVRRVARANAPGTEIITESTEPPGPSLDDETGVGAVIRTGESRLGTAAAIAITGDVPFESTRRGILTQGSCAISVPLIASHRAIGALSLAYVDSNRRYDRADLSFAQEIARRAAIAVENARLFEAQRSAHERLHILAEASATLGASIDYETTLRNVARLAVPALGDSSFFEVIDDDGIVRRVGTGHADPAMAPLLERSPRSARLYPDAHPVARALKTRTPQIVSHVTDAWIRAIATDDAHLELIRKLGPSSLICLPLVTRGQPIGALTLCFSTSGRHHTDEDLRLAEEVAHRAAMAVDNARLFKESQDAIHLRDDFLSIASHELNTPLTPLKMQIGMLRRGMTSSENVAKLAVADRQIDRMTKLVSRLLDVSRIVGGRLSLEPESVNLAGILHDVVGQFREEAQKHGSELHLSVEGDAVGSFDRVRVEQVVVNLVTNAIKYGGAKPIELDLRVIDGVARIAVRDHGIGIEPIMQKRIFERFERAVSARHYGGFGLGLWIARQIVEASGGRIGVESSLGAGSTFTVDLPLARSDASTAAE